MTTLAQRTTANSPFAILYEQRREPNSAPETKKGEKFKHTFICLDTPQEKKARAKKKAAAIKAATRVNREQPSCTPNDVEKTRAILRGGI